ncbi:MAG: hypothetical protein ACFE8N_05650 [Promethearchaeota archaeon]
MEIKCPICGKKYYYDSKICLECEDYSIYSGVSEHEGKLHHKWNCSIFLDIPSSAYKVSKVCDLTKDLSPEPNNLIIHERKFYDWNCESVSHSWGNVKKSSNSLTLGDFLTIMKSKSDSYLLYE